MIAADLSCADIPDNHVTDPFGSMRLVEQVLCQGRCHDLRNVLMLGNGEHLHFGQAAHGDAVLQRDHDLCLFLPAITCSLPWGRGTARTLESTLLPLRRNTLTVIKAAGERPKAIDYAKILDLADTQFR